MICQKPKNQQQLQHFDIVGRSLFYLFLYIFYGGGKGLVPPIYSEVACPGEISHLVANRTANLPNCCACVFVIAGEKQLDKLNLQIYPNNKKLNYHLLVHQA